MKNTKVTKRMFIYLLLTTCWIALIFSFSLQPAEISSEMSSGFGKMLMETFVPRLLEELEAMPEEQLGLMHHLLRKCAHFTEYFVLGALMMLTLMQTVFRNRIPTGIGACALVAVVDETIQRFVPGRSGQVTDVLLDSAGAAAGILAMIFLEIWFKKKKTKKELVFDARIC